MKNNGLVLKLVLMATVIVMTRMEYITLDELKPVFDLVIVL